MKSLDGTWVEVHKDMTKMVGGRTYFFAERHTDNGVYGFWVGRDWEAKQHQRLLGK
jgi:hypothetical protein